MEGEEPLNWSQLGLHVQLEHVLVNCKKGGDREGFKHVAALLKKAYPTSVAAMVFPIAMHIHHGHPSHITCTAFHDDHQVNNSNLSFYSG